VFFVPFVAVVHCAVVAARGVSATQQAPTV
jgi:hypothetical protein